jgi:hypothetical protein
MPLRTGHHSESPLSLHDSLLHAEIDTSEASLFT